MWFVSGAASRLIRPCGWRDISVAMRAFVAESPERLRSARRGNQPHQAHRASGLSRRRIGRQAKQKDRWRRPLPAATRRLGC
jgi:hypothetical protein